MGKDILKDRKELIQLINSYFNRQYNLENIYYLMREFSLDVFKGCSIDCPYSNEIISKLNSDTLELIKINKSSRIFSLYKFSEDFIRMLEKNNILNCYDWENISVYQILSESFIREFKDKVTWCCISQTQKLSEDFIREFQDKLDWYYITYYQVLSKEFIKEFSNKINFGKVSSNQALSEDFIRDFWNRLSIYDILKFQKLSEDLICEIAKKYPKEIDWAALASYQNLSEEFILNNIKYLSPIAIFMSKRFPEDFVNKICEEYKTNNCYLGIQSYCLSFLNTKHVVKTKEQKMQEMKEYAKKYNLEFDGEYLYAYRNHDKWGRGVFNRTIIYKKGKYYRDWHCDMDESNDCSFGLGIWPKGNTKVKVSVDDWGCCVDRFDGKCRVWGFTVI